MKCQNEFENPQDVFWKNKHDDEPQILLDQVIFMYLCRFVSVLPMIRPLKMLPPW